MDERSLPEREYDLKAREYDLKVQGLELERNKLVWVRASSIVGLVAVLVTFFGFGLGVAQLRSSTNALEQSRAHERQKLRIDAQLDVYREILRKAGTLTNRSPAGATEPVREEFYHIYSAERPFIPDPHVAFALDVLRFYIFKVYQTYNVDLGEVHLRTNKVGFENDNRIKEVPQDVIGNAIVTFCNHKVQEALRLLGACMRDSLGLISEDASELAIHVQCTEKHFKK